MSTIRTFLLIFSIAYSFLTLSASAEVSHRPASDAHIVSYAKNLLLTIVDNNFRGSWVVDPENWDKVAENTKKAQRSFDVLGKIKIGYTQGQVREILGKPQETKNNKKIWIYGSPLQEGTYAELFEVFYDDKLKATGIISFNPKDIPDKVGVNIGTPIEKIISIYGEPIDEKDFIEDPDNKDCLGLYYLYPRSGIGFLVGQDKVTKNLSVEGVLVFGKS